MSFLINPNHYQSESTDPKTQEMAEKIIAFHEQKGLKSLCDEEKEFRFQEDWIRFQARNQIYATMFTPSGYGAEDSRYDLRRNSELNELISFFSGSHQYSSQVTILGTGPIWMGENEQTKERAAKMLQEGKVFGFGCSEKAHGADLYSNEMTLTKLPDGTYRADGSKYYIGNANIGHISCFGRIADTKEWVFFYVDSQHPAYNCKKQITCTNCHSAFVGEFHLSDYPITEADIISRGDRAWSDALGTINIGKFNIGVSTAGGSAHALYEALHHSYNRYLYGKRVTDMPHIRRMFTESYLRLIGIRLYAQRAIDYFRVCSESDRRYLLYNPVSKVKQGTEAVKVSNLLLDAVVARAVETESRMESYMRSVPFGSKLEGTAHINLGLVFKCMQGYFFHNVDFPEVPHIVEPVNDAQLFHQTSGKMSEIQFPDYHKSFERLRRLPNVDLFIKQAELLQRFFTEAAPSKEQFKNLDHMLNLCELFTYIPYAQLIAEASEIYHIQDDTMNQLFKLYIVDFCGFAIAQASSRENTPQQEAILREIASIKPQLDQKQFEQIWTEQVEPLNDAYIMPQ